MKVAALLLVIAPVAAFMPQPSTFRQARHVVYIDDKIAELIDQQLWRQGHKNEVEAAFQQRNAAVIEKELPSGFDFDDHVMEDMVSPRQLGKDRFLASRDPAAYCVDRCIATGNCDVFEDIFHLSPLEVQAFCKDCVISDGEEPCDVPEAFLEEGFAKLKP